MFVCELSSSLLFLRSSPRMSAGKQRQGVGRCGLCCVRALCCGVGHSPCGSWRLWVTKAVSFIFLCWALAPLNRQEMRGPEFYLCPSGSLFVNCRSKSNIMYKIQTGQLLVSCREWALKEISWLPDLLNEVWVLVSILLGNDMWIEYLYKQAFIFVNGWKLVKKRREICLF